MILEQIYTKCLSEASYFISSNGEAAVIDPVREPDMYLELLEKTNSKLKYIFETHFHADFVSGHIELARLTGATIIFGPTANPEFTAHIAEDGEVINLGELKFKVLHTPGHTMESSCYLLFDESGKEKALFSGDTLFIGDVGRPDLAVSSEMTSETLAAYLYDSLRNKVMVLPKDIMVYPAHGQGSACGKNMSKETSDTLANQLLYNYALDTSLSKDKFIEIITHGQPLAPEYFAKNAGFNKKGYRKIEDIIEQGNTGFNPSEFVLQAKDEVIVLDTRSPGDFKEGHFPNSINIGLDGQFAIWAATVIPNLHTPLLLITEEGKLEESLIRLTRVGFDTILGHLKGGFQSYKSAGHEIAHIPSIKPEDVLSKFGQGYEILDVRREGERAQNHIEGSLHISLEELQGKIEQLDKSKNYLVHCAGGYRSVIAESVLKKNGFLNISDIEGGMAAIGQVV